MTAANDAGSLLDSLISTLRSEQQALVRGETDALPDLAEAKANAFEAMSRAMRGSGRAERLMLLDAMTTAQRLNDVNAALVAARMSANRARLDVVLALAGSAREPSLYGTSGALSAATPLGPTISA